MKKSKILRIFLIISLLLLSASLFSCKNQISSEEAKGTTEQFIATIEGENYLSAAELMHPDTKATSEYIENFISTIEKDYSIDFSNGTDIKKYTVFSSATYDGTIGGGRYSLNFDIKIDSCDFSATVEIKRTDSGYGIYNVHFDKK